MTPSKALRGFVIGLFCVVSIAGCGGSTSTEGASTSVSQANPTQLEQELKSKPSLETAQAEYQAAVENMARNIAALTPGTTWNIEQNTWVGCGGEYAETKAETSGSAASICTRVTPGGTVRGAVMAPPQYCIWRYRS